ncbi:prepilin-type N-terminal cleavage/methylation domain-containing protein [Planctomycetes bacterium Pan216]|uniref:prepilin-type N-terminal cleavage/methylation domain-containing protein n=1 Tax=Kolteria novifilia TaxID=2527975 RepID=UPI0011A67267
MGAVTRFRQLRLGLTQRPGLTLVEVIVVVMILLVMIVLLLPSLPSRYHDDWPARP